VSRPIWRCSRAARNAVSKRPPFGELLAMPSLGRYDFLQTYVVPDLSNVIDFDAIAPPVSVWASIRWAAPACTIGTDRRTLPIDLAVSQRAGRSDVQFHDIGLGRAASAWIRPRPMRCTLDRPQGKIRHRLACDTDHDRHGIVVPSEGLYAAETIISASRSTICLEIGRVGEPKRRWQDRGQQRHVIVG